MLPTQFLTELPTRLGVTGKVMPGSLHREPGESRPSQRKATRTGEKPAPHEPEGIVADYVMRRGGATGSPSPFFPVQVFRAMLAAMLLAGCTTTTPQPATVQASLYLPPVEYAQDQ